MLANTVKGELALETGAGPLILCFPWSTQKAIGTRFGRSFRQVMAGLEALSDEDLEWFIWAALQSRQPDLEIARVGELIDELGFNKVWAKINESLALAYDIDLKALDQVKEGPSADPPAAREGT